MKGWLAVFIGLSLLLWLIRLLWLHWEEQAVRKKLAQQASTQLESQLEQWRKRRGRQLFWYLLGLPVVLFLLLVWLGEFAQ